MSSRQDVISLFLTKPEKPKAVELIGVRVYFFVSMNGIESPKSVPAGMVTPLENVKGRRARRFSPTLNETRKSREETPSVNYAAERKGILMD